MQILQESALDESDLKDKLRDLKLHSNTIDFTVENFEKTYVRFKAVLGEDQ